MSLTTLRRIFWTYSADPSHGIPDYTNMPIGRLYSQFGLMAVIFVCKKGQDQ